MNYTALGLPVTIQYCLYSQMFKDISELSKLFVLKIQRSSNFDLWWYIIIVCTGNKDNLGKVILM